MADEKLEDVQRWTAKRRSALVMQVLKGETSAQEAARKHGLTVAEVGAVHLAVAVDVGRADADDHVGHLHEVSEVRRCNVLERLAVSILRPLLRIDEESERPPVDEPRAHVRGTDRRKLERVRRGNILDQRCFWLRDGFRSLPMRPDWPATPSSFIAS